MNTARRRSYAWTVMTQRRLAAYQMDLKEKPRERERPLNKKPIRASHWSRTIRNMEETQLKGRQEEMCSVQILVQLCACPLSCWQAPCVNLLQVQAKSLKRVDVTLTHGTPPMWSKLHVVDENKSIQPEAYVNIWAEVFSPLCTVGKNKNL